MTDASGGQEPSPYRRPRWTDRARELARTAGPGLVDAVRTGWRRLLPLLRRLQEAAEVDLPAPPPSDEVVEHPEVSGLIRVAAKGHAYTFTVRAVFTWSATGVRQEALIWCAHHFTPAVNKRLWRLAADHAREVEAHQADDLEVALQAALDEEAPWRYAYRGVSVECRPEVWVRHDDRVRQALQAHWDRMMQLNRQYEMYLTRARYAEDLNRRWVALLAQMPRNPAGGAEAEAISEEFARAQQHMAAEQRAAAQWSEELLRDREYVRTLFEPFTAIDIIPQQASGADRDAAGGGGAGTTSQAAEPTPSGGAPPKAAPGEDAPPNGAPGGDAGTKPGQDERR